MRRLSDATYNKYLTQLNNGQPLTNVELRSIKRAINFGATQEQLNALLMAAENCNCQTPKGTLIGFESQYSMDLGTEFKPIFKAI